MFNRNHLWYCFPPLLILCIFAATFSFVHSQNRNRQNPTPEAQIAELKASQEIIETLQTLPTVANRVLQLATETLNESFLKLATYDDGQYFEPGYMDQGLTEDKMQTLLSNRRAIKVLQEFEQLPRDQAETKAKELHKIAMDHLSRAIDAILAHSESFPPGPKSSDDKTSNDFRHAYFMAMTSLLLSGSLGDIPFLMQRIEEWEQIVANLEPRILQNEKMYHPFLVRDYLSGDVSWLPNNPTCLVSILMFAVERRGDVPEIVKNLIAEADCETVDIPLVAWNANKTYYEDIRYGGGRGTLS